MIHIFNRPLKTAKLGNFFDNFVSHEIVMEFIILDVLIYKVKKSK